MPKTNKTIETNLTKFFQSFADEAKKQLKHDRVKVTLHKSSNFDGDDIKIVFYNMKAGVEQTISFDREEQKFGQISFYSDIQI